MRVGNTGFLLSDRARVNAERRAARQESAVAPDVRDRELVLRLAQGDELAMRELVQRHGDMMFSLAVAILRDPADAQEACADAFLQTWRTAAQFDPLRGSVPGWLATITRSRALDRRRARTRRGAIGSPVLDTGRGNEPVTPPEDAPDRRTESTETRRLVEQAMTDLPEAQRRVIELAYFGGLSQSEIAEHLSIPLGTVKTRTLAAMKRLRDVLAPLLREEVA
jgi:RNA polymerase sigma-70 factor (ECF subfamily)